jgi:hypothetical protein
MDLNDNRTFIRRIAVALFVYAFFWLVLAALGYFQIWKAPHIALFASSAGRQPSLLTPVAYTVYFTPILIALTIVGYTSFTTLRLVRSGATERQFQNLLRRNVFLMFVAITISLFFALCGIGPI